MYQGGGGRRGGVVNDFDKWLPFFNVTFCGHATAAGGGGSRERRPASTLTNEA